MKIVCDRTEKQVYVTLQRALQHAARVARQRGQEYRVYRCEFCGYWHLTSRPRYRGAA